MATRQTKFMVIGYGNPGRRDDGLGPALAAALEELHLPDVAVEANYQLTVEDAAMVAAHDVVIFADADVAGREPFSFRGIPTARDDGTGRPRSENVDHPSFSTHSVTPEAVLALAAELFRGRPEAYVLGIRGYEFNEFSETLSERAAGNLAAAVRFLQSVLHTRAFREAASGSFGLSAALPAPAGHPCQGDK